MKRLATLALAMFVAAPALAAEPMSIVDMLVDQKEIGGQTLTLESCKMSVASVDHFMCSNGRGQNIFVDWPQNKDVVRRGMNDCAGFNFSRTGPSCMVTITGVVKTNGSWMDAIHAKKIVWNDDLTN